VPLQGVIGETLGFWRLDAVECNVFHIDGPTMSENPLNRGKRRFLIAATGVAGGVAGASVAIPFAMSMLPSARARAAGAPVEVDISGLEPGMMITEEWRGKPVWIVRRTPEMIATLPELDPELADPGSKMKQQPDYAKNEARSIKPEYLVLIGICTHLGCSPTQKLAPGGESGLGDSWKGGFFCPCHGSKFDLAGRVYKGVPAPTNLEVPPHTYVSDTRLVIGQDSKGAA
jgi:ubiquinol-cytochrome c reductase iron-sulfur subunit